MNMQECANTKVFFLIIKVTLSNFNNKSQLKMITCPMHYQLLQKLPNLLIAR